MGRISGPSLTGSRPTERKRWGTNPCDSYQKFSREWLINAYALKQQSIEKLFSCNCAANAHLSRGWTPMLHNIVSRYLDSLVGCDFAIYHNPLLTLNKIPL